MYVAKGQAFGNGRLRNLLAYPTCLTFCKSVYMPELVAQQPATTNAARQDFLADGGEMGALTRAFDWSTTILGPVAAWPQSLRTTVNLLLSAKVPMFLWWGADLIQFYNDAYRPSLGNAGKHPTALGQRGAACWPEIWPTISPLIAQVRAGGEATWSEDQLIPIYRKGRLENVYWTFGYSPVHDESGHVGGVLVVCTETTNQVAHLHSLQLSDQRFQNLVREASVGIIILHGEQLRVGIVNEACGRLLGRTPAELLDRPLFDFLPETEAEFRPRLDHVRRTGEPLHLYGHPYQVQTAGGATKEGFLDLVYQPYKEADGTITGVMVLCSDVTEQVRARQQHTQQQEHLYELFAQAPVAIAIFRGPRYVIELANPAVCALWGRTMAQTVGTPLFELLPEAAGQGFEKLLDEVMATGVPYVANELPALIDRAGQRNPVYWNFVYQPLREASGPVTAVTVVATDVTEQVRARKRVQELNQELATTNAQLVRTNVDLDTFIYTASHDLKQPIANIEGLLDALREHLPPEAYQVPLVPRLLTLMQQDVERFQHTIHQLTHVTRLQQAHEAPAEAVALASVIEAVRADLAPLLVGAQLTVAVPPGLRVYFPPPNLRSVVYNLLSNALKYRHPDRPAAVQLRAHAAGQMAVLEVEDNGLGLDAQQQAQLFGLFKRLHTHVEGSGMGLYIVKRLVENAGGTITVQSQPGAGSLFTVTFPA